MSTPTLIPVQCKPIWKVKNSKAVCDALQRYIDKTKQSHRKLCEMSGISSHGSISHILSGKAHFVSDEIIEKLAAIGLKLPNEPGVKTACIGVEYCPDIGAALELILETENIKKSDLVVRFNVAWSQVQRLFTKSANHFVWLTTAWVRRLRELGIDTAPGIELDSEEDQLEDLPITQQIAEQPKTVQPSTNGSQSFALVWNLVCNECIAQAIRDFMSRKEISSVRELAQLVGVHRNTINDLLAQKAVHVTDKVTEQFLASGLDLWALPSRKREFGGVRAIECVLKKLDDQYRLCGYDLRTMASKMAVRPSRLGQILKGKQELLTPEWIIAFRRIDLDLAPGVVIASETPKPMPIALPTPTRSDPVSNDIAPTVDSFLEAVGGKTSAQGVKHTLGWPIEELDFDVPKPMIEAARQSFEMTRALLNAFTQLRNEKMRNRVHAELEKELKELLMSLKLYGSSNPGKLAELVQTQRLDF